MILIYHLVCPKYNLGKSRFLVSHFYTFFTHCPREVCKYVFKLPYKEEMFFPYLLSKLYQTQGLDKIVKYELCNIWDFGTRTNILSTEM